jgi:hypothetical protein
MVDRLFPRMKLHVMDNVPDRISPFRSERYVITIQVGDNRYKVLQIVFSQKDGSLFVNFP